MGLYERLARNGEDGRYERYGSLALHAQYHIYGRLHDGKLVSLGTFPIQMHVMLLVITSGNVPNM